MGNVGLGGSEGMLPWEIFEKLEMIWCHYRAFWRPDDKLFFTKSNYSPTYYFLLWQHGDKHFLKENFLAFPPEMSWPTPYIYQYLGICTSPWNWGVKHMYYKQTELILNLLTECTFFLYIFFVHVRLKYVHHNCNTFHTTVLQSRQF